MDEAQKTRIKTLEWFLNFTNLNLREMDHIKQEIVQTEAIHYFLDPIPLTLPKAGVSESKGLNRIRKMVKLHNAIKEIPAMLQHNEGAVGVVDLYRDINGDKVLPGQLNGIPIDTLERIQKELLEILNSIKQSSSEPDEQQIISPNHMNKDVYLINTKGNLEAFLVVLIEGKDDLINSASMHFHAAVSGFHTENIQECMECGKYFVHTSLKPRYYCNPRCTSKAIARKHRQENPEEYNKKHRELLRRIYHKKKIEKAQQGKKKQTRNDG